MSIAELRRFFQKFNSGSAIPTPRETSGAKVSTFCIGGPLFLIEPQMLEDLLTILRLLNNEGIAFRILGNGSNILIPDDGVAEVTIRLGKGFRTLNVKSPDSIIVGGATSLMSLARELSEEGLSGIEFAGGIPASLGGAIWMNAGAHGGEMESIVRNIQIVLKNGDVHRLSRNEINFEYRNSGLPESTVVVDAELALVKSSKAETSERRVHFLSERKMRQPLTVPSAGSIFRNPSKIKSAGALIEEAGLRGTRSGGAEISSMHGNWIVNPERAASFTDVISLIELCQREVQSKNGIVLHPELIRW